MTADPILQRIRELGYKVYVFRDRGKVEMHAILPGGSVDPQVARCNDGDGPDEEYRCACLLAQAVGIDLEDG